MSPRQLKIAIRQQRAVLALLEAQLDDSNVQPYREALLDLAAKRINELEGLSNGTIAKHMGIAESTFRKNYSDELKTRGYETRDGWHGGWFRVRRRQPVTA